LVAGRQLGSLLTLCVIAPLSFLSSNRPGQRKSPDRKAEAGTPIRPFSGLFNVAAIRSDKSPRETQRYSAFAFASSREYKKRDAAMTFSSRRRTPSIGPSGKRCYSTILK
jgi:hypothetical protein